jgi:sugar-phosphatase
LKVFSLRLATEKKLINAVIFDMDGVLIDSEPLWHEAEIETFATVGVHLTHEMCIETIGVPVNEIVANRFKQKPWNGKSPEQVCNEILNSVERLILERAVLLDGVMKIIEFFKSHRIPIALASSTRMRLINTVVQKFNLKDAFMVIHSAEQEEYGKPHPSVFLTTAKKLHTDPTQCLIFEDSFNGLIAAKAARMKIVVLPMTAQWNESRFDIADLKLKSLAEFSEVYWNRLNTII